MASISVQALSAKSSTFGNAKALGKSRAAAKVSVARPVTMSAASGEVPDMAKRQTMNLLLLGAIGAPTLGLAGPYAYLFVPKSAGGAGGGIAAKDALGNDVKAKAWLAAHGAGDRSLTQGLKGDATYLIVEDDGKALANYGVNAVCTHLGCVVPWNNAENKFMCPCHGSQYNFQGKVVRGPAPLSLALAHADIDESDTVIFSTWSETDFRTGLAPWWK